MEDLHWVDPTTLDLLRLLVDQGPTTRILAVFTCRPDFSPPWTGRAHLTQVTVHRLPRRQAVEVIHQVAHGKVLPPEVVEQIVAKTDGVPLFVEELTKMVLESGLLQEWDDRYELTSPLPPLAIPATLHDSLMARLDRLATVKGLAQLGATLGREFSYELLRAVSPWDEATVQRGLHQLVEAEFLYQQGLPPQTTYVFKHALIQETAYQSLLKSTRQQYHQRIAQVLEAQFPETVEAQPELLAQHYTEGGLNEAAVAYWQRAGHRANARSSHQEAIRHLDNGLKVLKILPETPERVEHEIDLQIALGQALMAARGQGVPEVERAFSRAWALCGQVDEAPQIFPVLWGLWRFYFIGAKHRTALELGEQCLRLAQRGHDRERLLASHLALGSSCIFLGEYASARAHLEQGIVLYDSQEHHELAFRYGIDLKTWCLSYVAWPLWLLGYPDQALRRSHEALTLAQELAHPLSLTVALDYAAWLHQLCHEPSATQAHAEAAIALAREHGFPQYEALGLLFWGWTLAEQGQVEEGVAALRQGMAAQRAAGAAIIRPYSLAMLAEASKQEPEVGLAALAEALSLVDATDERWWEGELYRCKGGLLLRQLVPDAQEAEGCFHQALNIARRQEAKSLELRAAMSLGRLWQQQGKRDEAHELLAPVYGWFTEGFDTPDLQEARTLIEELAG
jgi:predicted ATPase